MHDPRSEAGFSFLEALVSSIILVLLLGALTGVLFTSQASFESQQDTMALRQQARSGVDRMATELRLIGYDITNVPEALLEATAERIVFAADIDDGDVQLPCGVAFETAADGGVERVTYERTGGNLFRSLDCWDGGSWTAEQMNVLVARDLLNAQPLFRYFDANGNQLDPGAGALSAADRALVRTISIQLGSEDLTPQALGDVHVDYSIETRIKIRNS